MKTEERKREAARPKPSNESAPSTPVQATPTPTQTEAPTVPPKDSTVNEDVAPGSHPVGPEEAPRPTSESNDQNVASREQNTDIQPPQVGFNPIMAIC